MAPQSLTLDSMKEKQRNIQENGLGVQQLENSPEAYTVRIPWKKIFLFDLLLIALLVLATRFATFLHEVFGHTLIALITGGEVHRIKISLFGGGMVWADLGSYHLAVVILYCYSGILVNLITGALPFFFIKKLKSTNRVWALFWAVFVMTSLLGTLAYLVLGLYYEFGDPVNWMRETPRWLALSWIPLLIAAPIVAYVASRLYMSVQQRLIPAGNFIGRLKITFATLGVSVLAYAGLFWLTDQSLASADAPVAKYRREATKIIEEKKKESAQRIKTVHPDLTEAEIEAQVDKTPIHVEPDEVPVKFPMVPVLAVLFLLGGLTAFKNRELTKEGMPAQPKRRTVFLLFLLAATVVSVLAYRDEIVYDTKQDCSRPGERQIGPGKSYLKMENEGVCNTAKRDSISISGMRRHVQPLYTCDRF
jgi:hypothetical protein